MDNKILNCYFRIENGNMIVGNDLFSKEIPDIVSAQISTDNCNNLSEPYVVITAKRKDTEIKYHIWENLPVLYMPEYCEKELLVLESEHWIIRNVKLYAFTDDHDTLTTENEYHLFRMMIDTCYGEIFILKNPEDGNAIVIISETPDYQTAALTIKDGIITVDNQGNGLAVGFCKIGESEALCKDYYRLPASPKSLLQCLIPGVTATATAVYAVIL